MESAAQQGVSVLNSLHGLLLSASEDSTPQGLGQSQHAVHAGSKSCLEAVSDLVALVWLKVCAQPTIMWVLSCAHSRLSMQAGNTPRS